MNVNGYIFRRVSDQFEFARFTSIPVRIDFPNGGALFNVTVGWSNGTYEFVAFSWTEPDPVPPTLDEIYDQTLITQQVLKAVVLALNDGTLPIATNKTGPQLKAIIKAKM